MMIHLVRCRPMLLLLLTAVMPLSAVWAADRQSPARPSPDTLVDMLLQMDLMQNEIKQLRNQVELQANEIERLKASQRDLLQDLDRRVVQLERGKASAPAAAASAPAAEQPPTKAPTKAPAAVSASPAQEQQAYEAAFNHMKQGFYERAVKDFRVFLEQHPQSPLAGNAQYWIGEANYVVSNYKLALEEFKQVEARYPSSPKVSDARLKIGYTYYAIGQWAEARRTLEEIVKQYPNSRVAKSAVRRLAKMKEEGH